MDYSTPDFPVLHHLPECVCVHVLICMHIYKEMIRLHHCMDMNLSKLWGEF